MVWTPDLPLSREVTMLTKWATEPPLVSTGSALCDWILISRVSITWLRKTYAAFSVGCVGQVLGASVCLPQPPLPLAATGWAGLSITWLGELPDASSADLIGQILGPSVYYLIGFWSAGCQYNATWWVPCCLSCRLGWTGARCLYVWLSHLRWDWMAWCKCNVTRCSLARCQQTVIGFWSAKCQY